MNRVITFCKNWTLPVAIGIGTVCYFTFYFVPGLDAAGSALLPVFSTLFPFLVFLSLLVTFCKVDFQQMRLHRWHVGVLAAQLLLVAANVAVIFWVKSSVNNQLSIVNYQLLFEAVLACTIAPTAAAAPVVAAKLGGNLSTITTYTLISSLASAVLIPVVFPLLEPTADVTFLAALLIILQKVSMVLLLPLILGWLMQRYAKSVCQRLAAAPNLGFYIWAFTLSIMTGITLRNIVHSEAGVLLLVGIAVATFVISFVQFGIGRLVGRWLGERVNSGQSMFQKNTALSIWVSYMYLHPVASVGAGCYVLWQNIINSLELWLYHKENDSSNLQEGRQHLP